VEAIEMAIWSMLTDEEVITNVDMDENASQREKNLAMRLANALDALADLQDMHAQNESELVEAA
jgi:hypothetical protein